jgi:ornithine cyclodeaminase/alanine dehydrogenase-like protein (mu-crystallin family)
VTALLVLGEHDVEELLDPAGCLDAVERALVELARGETFLPLRSIVRPEGADSLLGLMPAYRGGPAPLYGLKTVAVVPDNAARGLDPHQGMVALFDGTTGQTIALMNASPMTSIRTAAASALATRVLAREDARVLAIVGAGHQAKEHLRALALIRPFAEIRIVSRTPASATALADLHPRAFAAPSVEDAVTGADVITTVTSSETPVVRREWIAEGAHINAVGACFPHTRELDTATVAAAALFADRRESVLGESGDYLFALGEGAIGQDHVRAELGEVLAGMHPGRTDASEVTIFESLGIAVEDLFAAEYVVDRARALGRGVTVEF